MGMSFNKVQVANIVRQTMDARVNMAIQVLQYIGEQCVNEARNKHKYTDRTGNLSSSIGYVVSNNGKIIGRSDFSVVKEGGEGSSGGLKYAEQLAAEYPKHVVLIVVAGMNYAHYVNNMGLDVLDSAEILAEKQVPKLLRRLGFTTTK